MMTRQEYERYESDLLAPYAMRSSTSRGRVHDELDDPYRTAFQRDKDRVIHSTAFRRLEYKTQVFIIHEGDYYRTRLTHSLEVAQIARGIARTLRLNEDLAETIALAHDLGHTPFGHRGEETLDELMKHHGGFEHNRQSLRVVTKLEERYPDFPGLNLSIEVLEGLARHESEYDSPSVNALFDAGAPLLEAQVVNVADEIAYLNHDIDDGLQSSLIDMRDLMDVPLWGNLMNVVRQRYPTASGKVQRYQAIRRLINKCVRDVQEETIKNIRARGIGSIVDVRENGSGVVVFSDELSRQIKECHNFLYKKLYKHPKVQKIGDNCARILKELFEAYVKNPSVLPKRLFDEIKARPNKVERYVCDYIAGMTDRFAENEYRRIVGA